MRQELPEAPIREGLWRAIEAETAENGEVKERRVNWRKMLTGK